MKYIIGLLILCIIIIFHEFGHFIAAKLSGVYVEEFAVGMGPTLVKHKSKKSGTVYSIHLLPIGGFCAMKGENGDDKESDSFASASVLKRIAIIACGPIFNLIMAFVVAVILIAGTGYDKPVVKAVTGKSVIAAGLEKGDTIVKYNDASVNSSKELYFEMWYNRDIGSTKDVNMVVKRNGKVKAISYKPDTEKKFAMGISYAANDSDGTLFISNVMDDSAAEKAGLKTGDVIVSLDDQKASSTNSLSDYLQEHPLDGSEMKIGYERNGKSHTLTLTPIVTNISQQGFSYNMKNSKSSNVLLDTFYELRYNAKTVYKSLYGLVTGKFSLSDMSGPVAIVKTMGDTYQEAVKTQPVNSHTSWIDSFSSLMNLIIMISVNLGVLNLIPLPALDGGHLFFLLIELIRRKPVNPKVENMIHQVGLTALIALSIVVIFKDVWSLLI